MKRTSTNYVKKGTYDEFSCAVSSRLPDRDYLAGVGIRYLVGRSVGFLRFTGFLGALLLILFFGADLKISEERLLLTADVASRAK